ncbi:MAG: SoxR reducing system RseC family protein [Rikenellaceae bacterium]|nr:SoxR reducing system RseC family protein [Rikenellaceae bacterium]
MKNEIRHNGLIFDIVGNRVDVAVTPESACAACKAAAMCMVSDKEEKVVSVLTEHPEIYEIGEQVEVAVGRGMGVKAVLLAYVVPFVVLLTALLSFLGAGAGEVSAGLLSLGAVVLYYACLYFFRKHIESEIVFKINKIK